MNAKFFIALVLMAAVVRNLRKQFLAAD